MSASSSPTCRWSRTGWCGSTTSAAPPSSTSKRANTPVNTKWRNRATFVNGRDEVVAFLADKWAKELDYRLVKELWAFTDNRIAVRYAYEYHHADGNWFRAYGNENWEFDENGLMTNRHASINDLPIKESERLFHWPLGRRPDDTSSLSELGL
ncbi:DUF1348 family protein [Pararhodobacter sp.]|uniref:DUF1348 family protein n=1 Tax=Pararhodobacter sp. TaxID=2127056 RepID=UPI003A599035